MSLTGRARPEGRSFQRRIGMWATPKRKDILRHLAPSPSVSLWGVVPMEESTVGAVLVE